MNKELETKLQNLPSKPGIYQFFDQKENIIYVGKAKNLKNRVRSYFHSSVDNPKTLIMIKKVVDLQLIVTDSEVEALVLENNLIKELKPRYNILLKDDKTFPYIRITNEPYPRIFTTRQLIKDGSKYFGPYTDVKSLKKSLRMINQIFKIRSCKLNINQESIDQRKFKVCLDFHIKKCDGPCEGLISEEKYNAMVDQAAKLLRGKTDQLISELSEEMMIESTSLNFEKAAELRDKIDQLKVYSEKQKIVTTDALDRDIISIANEDSDVACTILNIRSGKLVGKKNFKLSTNMESALPQLYSSALRFYYNEYVDIPKEIIVEVTPADEEAISLWLCKKSERKIKFVVPKIQSEPKALLEMCKKNAVLHLKDIQLQKMKKEGNTPYILSALKRDLRLKNIPKKIECFDISNIQGSDTVASMVVFVDGKPKKSLYRRFIIKTVDGPNDFASMQEVIQRRYQRVWDEKEPLADLVMVDGGKGQLSSAVEILNDIGFENYEIIGLAKRLEEVFFPGISEAQTIPKTSSSLKLLQAVRDEAHRFAITFHRERRDKRTLTTELLEIKGIGKKIAEKLLTDFNSIEEIRTANMEKLAASVGAAKAKLVFEHYNA
ncbi:MAG: excinuclease ABC subunit UvrC [Rhodothermaceae bacterium]